MKPFLLSIAFSCMALLVLGNLNKSSVNDSTGPYNLAEVSKEITGTWRAVGSSGGITGKGFTLDFDYLTLRDDGTFELKQKGSVIARGKYAISKEKETFICNFIFDKTADLQLALDPEKQIQLPHADTLDLIAPCCDRYSIKLAREK